MMYGKRIFLFISRIRGHPVYSQHYWRFLNVSCWYNLIIKVQEIFLHTSEVDLWILINIYIENEAIAWW